VARRVEIYERHGKLITHTHCPKCGSSNIHLILHIYKSYNKKNWRGNIITITPKRTGYGCYDCKYEDLRVWSLKSRSNWYDTISIFGNRIEYANGVKIPMETTHFDYLLQEEEDRAKYGAFI
jgi:hypothetical protein